MADLTHGIFDRIVFEDDVAKVFVVPTRKVFPYGEFHSRNDPANRNVIPELIHHLQFECLLRLQEAQEVICKTV